MRNRASLALLLVFFILSLARPIQAQTATFAGLDVIFLVDQSGSMGGTAFGCNEVACRNPTDPLGLRFQAVQYATDTLGEYRVGIAPNVPMRLAVVSFGDSAKVTLDWTQIASPVADWDTQRTQLLNQLSEAVFRGDNPPGESRQYQFCRGFPGCRSLSRVASDNSCSG